VSFADDTKPVKEQNVNQFGDVQRKGFFTTNSNNKSVLQISDDDRVIGSMPVIPADESTEDAALRGEMLAYSLSEVGAIVAEIDLEEGEDEDYTSNDSENVDDSEISEEDEEENEYGMSSQPIMTKEMENRMAELQRKLRPLESPMSSHVTADPSRLQTESTTNDRERQELTSHTDITTALHSEYRKGAKEGVKFADNLDIAPASDDVSSRQSKGKATEPKKASLSTTDFTDTSTNKISPIPTRVPEHERNNQSHSEAVPNRPRNQILSDQIIERNDSTSVKAPRDDGLDPGLHQREVAMEYYKKRNAEIKKQGGFMPSQEEEENPLYEHRDGQIKKVSRFKAAKLKSSVS
jgi:unconventional prefoldin RPB5 interactor 1